MTDRLERQIRDVLADEAAAAPAADGVVREVRRRARRRARLRAAVAAALVVPVLALGAGVAVSVSGAGSGDDNGGVGDVSAQPVITGTGEVPDGGNNFCAALYSPTEVLPVYPVGGPSRPEVEEILMAFDGTVTAIGSPLEYRGGYGLFRTGYSTVTFTVHEWFTSDTDDTITVEMMSPARGGFVDDLRPPTYGVGTRLLVMGARDWADESKAAESRADPSKIDPDWEDAMGWGCGFTRYHDEETADLWRDRLGDLG